MLGKNIGRKVGANFVNTQYQAFLTEQKDKKNAMNKAEQAVGKVSAGKPPMSKAHKRDEMRKKGIFVQADSDEMELTIMEKTRSASRPFICPPRTRKMKWKQIMRKLPNVASMESLSTRDISEKTQSREKTREKKHTSIGDEKERTSQISTKQKATAIPTATTRPVGEKEVSGRKTEEASLNNLQNQKEKTGSAESLPNSTTSQIIADEKICSKPELSMLSERQAITTTTEEPATVDPEKSNTSKGTRKDDVFGALEEDVDLTKVLDDFNVDNIVGVGSDDKRALDAAQKILKVAYKEKAFEKTLTKEENDTLGKFFSGKIPYDANVLNVLDGVLDKTIEYFRANKTNLDPETKALIEQRAALKAAMLQTMLAKPTFIPSEWVKQYEAYRQEALKQTTGINWARVGLLYPRHRAFDDGAADIFGNFTRARRGHWLWGCIFGPTDSKSFEEVDREKKSQGFYMDTAIMEDAKQNVEEVAQTTGSVRVPENAENRVA